MSAVAVLDQVEEALPWANEAVTVLRQLAAFNPAAHLPDLATSLNTMVGLSAKLCRWDEVVRLAQEALAIRRELAKADSAAHAPSLAILLKNLSSLHMRIGQQGDAVRLAEEAVTIGRQLAQTNSTAHSVDLAISLGTYADACASGNLALPTALAAVDEAIKILEPSAGQYPMIYGRLQAAYGLRADILDSLGRTD